MQPIRSVLNSLCVTLGLCAVIASAVWAYSRIQESTPKIVFTPTGPTVEQLQELSELVSLQVTITDVLAAETEGWGGYRGAWLIKGDALYSTDLGQAEITELQRPGSGSLWRISLPLPAIKWARVDHERSRTYDLHRKHWLPWDSSTPTTMRDEAMRRGQRLVLQGSMKPEYLHNAKLRTEQTLKSFCAAKGTVVEVVWRASPAEPLTPPTPPEVAQR